LAADEECTKDLLQDVVLDLQVSEEPVAGM